MSERGERSPEQEGGRALVPLLDHLANAMPDAATHWRGWRITPIPGGANNRLYRATDGGDDLAVKFTIRDERDRAGREYHALAALRGAGLAIAPRPVLLERERYPQPVVVQTWLAGAPLDEPPVYDDDWRALVAHLATLHTLTPERVSLPLPPAVLDMRSAEEGRARVREQLARLPEEARPPALRDLVARVERAAFPAWPVPTPSLCKGDPNIRNFLRRPKGWAAVDWEYSGWGDPAFELADLITHPAYLAVPPDRWPWLVEAYCSRRPDPGLATRVRTYIRLMLVWWVVRFARLLYETPRGLDRRLVDPPATWQAATRAKYDHYLRSARALLATS